MTQIALYNFVPRFCPACGLPTELDRKRTDFDIEMGVLPYDSDYRQGASCGCKCGLVFQMANERAMSMAALEFGGDLPKYI